jgi:hypothetical protein
VYFLNGSGWYRLLLPGHLVLLPFVPLGARTLLKRRMFVITLLSGIALAQGLWQLDHRGSNPSREGLEAIRALQENYVDHDLFIEQTEIFALLPDNPRWRFLMPQLSFSMPREYGTISGENCKIPFLRKLNPEELQTYPPAQLTQVSGRYHIVRPPYPCPRIAP